MVFGAPGQVVLTATVRDSSGNPLTGAAIRWSSSNPSVVRAGEGEPDTSSTAGAFALAAGQATITATVDGVAGTATVKVLTATVEPVAATLAVGQQLRVVATVRDAAGMAQTGWTAAWYSRAENATVDVGIDGLVMARTPGIELVTVTFQHPALFGIGTGGSAFARITVGTGGPVASVAVEPDTLRTVPIALLRLIATVLDSAGDSTYAELSWSISPQQCAQFTCNGVEPDGNLWNVGRVQMHDVPGTFAVTAAAGGRSATATVISDYITIASLSEGGSCALTPSGAAYCSGGFYGGPAAVGGGLTFSAITSGSTHHCALSAGGAAYCWGLNNDFGQLGTVASLRDCEPHATFFRGCSPSPVPVAGGLSFARITSGAYHTCGLTAAGAAYCWGNNASGQLGDGTTAQRSTPVAVAGGLAFAHISASYHHTCGLTAGGAAYCWGNNWDGRLGDGTTTDRVTPVAVAGGLTFTSIAAAGSHTCALTATGAAYCWGDRAYLGNPTGGDSPTPVPVGPGLAFTQIGGHTCGLTAAGAVYCWGAYYANPWDDNDTAIVVAPTLLGGGLTFASLSPSGGPPSCGITTSGVAYCWSYSVGFGPYPGDPRKLWGQR
jgi:hypothetical protein